MLALIMDRAFFAKSDPFTTSTSGYDSRRGARENHRTVVGFLHPHAPRTVSRDAALAVVPAP